MGANLKEVRDRIKSVKSTQQITKAMKMVSAAKLRKAQQAIVQMRPYANKLSHMLSNILSNIDGDASTSFGEEREIKNACVVIVTSSRGLAGAFNSNVVKAAIKVIESKYSSIKNTKNLSILCIGKKGFDGVKKKYAQANIITEHLDLFSDLTFENVAVVSKGLMRSFEEFEYDEVFVSFGQFKNAGVQYPFCTQFLPVPKLEASVSEGKTIKADYLFEPDKVTLLNRLIPSILQTQFHRYVLDTHASEHGARMTAMDKATENAEDMLKDLKVNYNKARQEAITNELSEIVGGAAALESS